MKTATILYFFVTFINIQLQMNPAFSGDVFGKSMADTTFYESELNNFIQIPSTIHDTVRFAIAVYKPEKPSPILITTHGWHGQVKRPSVSSPNPFPGFLTIQVDMRGRKYSTGTPDCNGYELYDYYDAYKYATEYYKQYISDPELVYFFGGSGGGGNGYGLLGKFPDLFVSAVIYCGISDYALWFEGDSIGEFRDEMVPWIGFTPYENKMAYDSRSGITTVKNILTPIFIVHGETDVRVPSYHARNYYDKALKHDKKIEYLELKNVGTRDHWGNITKGQLQQREIFTRKGLSYYTNPIRLPLTGEMIVAGYLVTKYFSVFLDSIDDIGVITYNVENKTINFKRGSGRVIWR